MTPVIPIGVTARNEAKNILALLDSLRRAAAKASAALGCAYELHVLLNDNDDNTPELLASVTDVTVWNTSGGLVEAQRTLIDRRGRAAPFVIFSDADILIHPDTLLEISRAMSNPAIEVAYAEKYPLPPARGTPLAKALYFYNLREGYQTARHYFNGQFFAIRQWRIPRRDELRWNPTADTPFLHLAAGIRCDDIYLSRDLLGRCGPSAIHCVAAGIRYRPPGTLRGMFRKYQRMRLEIERLNCYFPRTAATHRKWGRRRLDVAQLAGAPMPEKLYYLLFWLALCLCRIAYRAQKIYYTWFTAAPCPTWRPVTETKERVE